MKIRSPHWMVFCRTRITTLAGVLLMCAGPGVANAAVVLTDSAAQTVAGQHFTFHFSPVPQSDGTDGSFKVHARGDYSVDFPTFEYLDWDIDGLVSDTAAPDYGTVLQVFGFNDVQWEQTFSVSGALLSAITADGSVAISADLSSEVDIIRPYSFVEVELTYVPEPAALSLLALGAIGLIRRSRRPRGRGARHTHAQERGLGG